MQNYKEVLSENLYNGEKHILNVKGIYKNFPYFIISRNAPRAYIGISKGSVTHNIFKKLNSSDVFLQNNGCTYLHDGGTKHRPDEFLWIGWDYAHLGDYAYFKYDNKEDVIMRGERYGIEEIKSHIHMNINSIINTKYIFLDKLIYDILRWDFRSISDGVLTHVEIIEPFKYNPEIIKNFKFNE